MGIGVFPLAASRFGIRPVWASEIEKFLYRLQSGTFRRWSIWGHYELNGGAIQPVHVITFGSPCQNLSTMGAREGLSGSKSGLFYDAIRIIKEMRCASHGLYPVFAVWENVAGAFTSGNGMDFRAVLEAFQGTGIPNTWRWEMGECRTGGRAWPRSLLAAYGRPVLGRRQTVGKKTQDLPGGRF